MANSLPYPQGKSSSYSLLRASGPAEGRTTPKGLHQWWCRRLRNLARREGLERRTRRAEAQAPVGSLARRHPSDCSSMPSNTPCTASVGVRAPVGPRTARWSHRSARLTQPTCGASMVPLAA